MFSSMLSLLGSLRGGATSFITNSLRFRSSASANLTRTPSVAGNQRTWTWSSWIKIANPSNTSRFYVGRTGANFPAFGMAIGGGGIVIDQYTTGAALQFQLITSSIYRDPSAWYHLVVAFDTTQGTPANRIKVYVNGSQITAFSTASYPTENFLTNVNTAATQIIGGDPVNNAYFDGYLTEVHFIDGQALTPASFGAINSSTGVWAPSPYGGTYGANGFYLKFADASAATAAAIGKDSSGNGNNWTPNNISVTAGATYDSMIDVPVNYSDGGNGRGNYAVLNPLDKNSSITTRDANLTLSNSSAGSYGSIRNSINMTTGKWYMEFSNQTSGGPGRTGCGLYTGTDPLNTFGGGNSTSWAYHGNGFAYSNGPTTALSTGTYGVGDIIMMAFDADNGRIWFGKNGTWNGDPVAGTGSTYSGLTSASFFFGGWAYNTSDITNANFGQRPFQNTAVWATLQAAGFRALNTNNLPTPSIVNGANFMAATTYTGTAGVQSIPNTVNSVSFQPDLVWIKSRTPGATSHALFDSVRGTTKYLSSDTTAAETTLAGSLTAFNANGFSLGTATAPVNTSANSYIAWQWKESITAGLDIVSYTGTGVNRTVAHNLGVAPAMIIVKRSQTGATSNWQVRHTSIPVANSIQLNSVAAAAAATTVWNSTAPTSSEFSLGTFADVNASGISYVAYCFAQIAGFSRFGSYTGNGLADGPFVFCGFRPRFVMIKRTDVANDWVILDTSRNTYNFADSILWADLANTETAGTATTSIDCLSNGFKSRGAGSSINATSGTYIFAAFAEVPSKYALAR